MKKRCAAAMLALAIFIGLTIPVSATGNFANFNKVNSYAEGQFQDVLSGAWYADDVRTAYEYGLINGKSASSFEPDSSLTVAEAIKLAVGLHSIYNTGTVNIENGTPWYSPFVEYAVANGIITANSYTNYDVAARRSDFAVIFANALPNEALEAVNTVDDGAVPDVAMSSTYAAAVYKLYRAGILTGSDDAGSFMPESNIKRSEAAAILTRMTTPDSRKTVTLTVERKELTAQEIAAKCSAAVFYIEVSYGDGEYEGAGSGFFISSSGIAVTNYHVMQEAKAARITTTDGNTYDVIGVYDYSIFDDVVLMQIDGSGFTALEPGDSRNLAQGATIYTIGSPLGLSNTLSTGLISNTNRNIDGTDYIQISAAISSGSSGGALINAYGQVIGITTASYVYGQNLNLAVPFHKTETLERETYFQLSDMADSLYYEGYYPVVSFGAFTKLTMTSEKYNKTTYATTYTYDAKKYTSSMLTGYIELMESCGFEAEEITQSGETYWHITYWAGLDVTIRSTSASVTVTVKPPSFTYYDQYPSVADFGSLPEAEQENMFSASGSVMYTYNMKSMKSEDIEELVWVYDDLLRYYCGFELVGAGFEDDELMIIYENSVGLLVAVSISYAGDGITTSSGSYVSVMIIYDSSEFTS